MPCYKTANYAYLVNADKVGILFLVASYLGKILFCFLPHPQGGQSSLATSSLETSVLQKHDGVILRQNNAQRDLSVPAKASQQTQHTAQQHVPHAPSPQTTQDGGRPPAVHPCLRGRRGHNGWNSEACALQAGAATGAHLSRHMKGKKKLHRDITGGGRVAAALSPGGTHPSPVCFSLVQQGKYTEVNQISTHL